MLVRGKCVVLLVIFILFFLEDASLPRLQQLVELALGPGARVSLRSALSEERSRVVAPSGQWQGGIATTAAQAKTEEKKKWCFLTSFFL